MKIILRASNGAEIRFEKEPMDREKFNTICALLAGMLVVIFFLGLFSIFK